jgi:NADH-quinone oxidoreductase subunit M
MILAGLILLLMGCGLLAWLAARWSHTLARIISLAGLVIQLIAVIVLCVGREKSSSSEWIISYTHAWVPAFGIQIKLAADGLSLLMLLLTSFLGILSVLVSWKEINQRVGFFHFNLMFVLAGITGVFLSMDLFLFYFSWEVMLIPMYFLISIWGNENKTYAAYKFFLFTQASGLLMFLSIIGLYLIHGHNTGVFTFDYQQLIGTKISSTTALLLMIGFAIAFMVKLSTVPFHSWLPDAHTQAPTAGSVILAGLLLKTGAYGLIRFVLPLFPQASHQFAPIAMTLGVISILYGAKLAFAQTDLKRLVAYISVSHMGFILLGIYAFNEMAMQGVVMQMIAHGVSTGALFIIAGAIHERIQTRDIGQMGGLWAKVPKMGAMALVFVMASLGLPGLGNFVAEILILAGAFFANKTLTIMATLGLVAATVYSLRIMQKVFYGREQKVWPIADFGFREMGIMTSLALATIWLGLFPSALLNISKTAVLKVIEYVNQTTTAKAKEVGVIQEQVGGAIGSAAISKAHNRKITL